MAAGSRSISFRSLKTPICVTEEDLKGYEFEPGEDVREAGERLAASYVNFYISNGGVVVPQFGDENDETAVRILAELFPETEGASGWQPGRFFWAAATSTASHQQIPGPRQAAARGAESCDKGRVF